MSYQVLARKWRPQTFQQVIGQPHVLTALENGLKQDRVHHAYLFSGTRGVGKTTIARIFAKSLNCELGVTATPCGTCANCIAIDQGRFVDLLEIDAASRTKVDDTRELLDNVQYKPAQGRYKVYLIDEVHMLSKHSFNALLKTLEEPPEYVKFLLATTDPQKLPITVLSRCLQFHLKAILPEQIEHQLATILAHEQARYEQGALSVIAKAADGSMRDALSLTDQALAFGAGNIKYAAVLKMLGTIDQSHLHYLLHFIASGNSQKVFEKIQEFVHLGADFSALHQELASLCHQIALMQLQLNANVTEKTAVQLLAERLTPEEVQLFYQIALQGYKDYAFAPNGKVALEMTVMRLLAFKPANYVDIDESMLNRAQQVETVEAVTEVASLIPPVANSPLPESVAEQVQVVAPSVTAVNIERNVEVDSNQTELPHYVQDASPTVIEPRNEREPLISELPTEEASDFHASPGSFASDSEEKMLASESGHFQNDATHDASINVSPNMFDQENNTVSNGVNEVDTRTLDMQSTLESNNQKTSEVMQQAEQTSASSPSKAETIHAPSLTSSNSRNMLRSHRLKREELKKTEAAVDPLTELNGQSVASVNPIVSAPTINEPLEALNKRSQQEVAGGVKKAEVKSSEQDLPPLSSYQSHSEHQHDNNYENDYENASFDNQPTDIEEEHTSLAPPQLVSAQTIVPAEKMRDIQPGGDPVRSEDSAQLTVVPTVNPDISVHQKSVHSATEVVLVNNGNIDSVEVDVASYVDDKMTDSWFLAIKAMQLVGFEKLLAKSTVMQQVGHTITLTLHEPQQHLLNNQKLCEDLKMKLRHYYGQEYTVNIVAGKVVDSHTPMELELIVYQEYLDNAKLSIKEDPIVQTLVGDYAAKVYENSVVPL